MTGQLPILVMMGSLVVLSLSAGLAFGYLLFGPKDDASPRLARAVEAPVIVASIPAPPIAAPAPVPAPSIAPPSTAAARVSTAPLDDLSLEDFADFGLADGAGLELPDGALVDGIVDDPGDSLAAPAGLPDTSVHDAETSVGKTDLIDDIDMNDFGEAAPYSTSIAAPAGRPSLEKL